MRKGYFLTSSTILFTWEMQRCIITKDFTAAAYIQKLQKVNVSEMDEFFILLEHTIFCRRAQVEKYLGLLKHKFKKRYVGLSEIHQYMILTSCVQKQADKALAQIATDNVDPKLDWKGWSEGGKKGLVELLEMMVKLHAKEKYFKASQENKEGESIGQLHQAITIFLLCSNCYETSENNR